MQSNYVMTALKSFSYKNRRIEPGDEFVATRVISRIYIQMKRAKLAEVQTDPPVMGVPAPDPDDDTVVGAQQEPAPPPEPEPDRSAPEPGPDQAQVEPSRAAEDAPEAQPEAQPAQEAEPAAADTDPKSRGRVRASRAADSATDSASEGATGADQGSTIGEPGVEIVADPPRHTIEEAMAQGVEEQIDSLEHNAGEKT